jgi:excinuclease UvrABC ATPase subunit
MGSPFGNIEVRAARENNLENISLDIPRRHITVFTGVSGSGKGSLVRHDRRGVAAAHQRDVLDVRADVSSALRPAGCGRAAARR